MQATTTMAPAARKASSSKQANAQRTQDEQRRATVLTMFKSPSPPLPFSAFPSSNSVSLICHQGTPN